VQDQVTDALNGLLAIKGMEHYPFLVAEINRLKSKVDKPKGFNDSQIKAEPSCPN